MIRRAFVGLAAIRMHPRELVPAERAHRLQFGVALQGVDRFVEPALADQRQAQAVPGPVELGVERQGAAEGGFGRRRAGPSASRRKPRLNQSAALRSGCCCDQPLGVGERRRGRARLARAGGRGWRARRHRSASAAAWRRTRRWRPGGGRSMSSAIALSLSRRYGKLVRFIGTARSRRAGRCRPSPRSPPSRSMASSTSAASGMWRSSTTRGAIQRTPLSTGPVMTWSVAIEEVPVALRAGQKTEDELTGQRHQRDLHHQFDCGHEQQQTTLRETRLRTAETRHRQPVAQVRILHGLHLRTNPLAAAKRARLSGLCATGPRCWRPRPGRPGQPGIRVSVRPGDKACTPAAQSCSCGAHRRRRGCYIHAPFRTSMRVRMTTRGFD